MTQAEVKSMNLRNKLPLSFIIFIVALVALGVWSALSLGLRSSAAATSRGRATRHSALILPMRLNEALHPPANLISHLSRP
jgi:quinol-cytochrome oxidoreductase complex cytochrome b subunit